jgi:hypothetical protein
MARRTFQMIDLIEVYTHWYAGRPKLAVAESLGLDVKTVRKYVRPAEEAGLTPGGPPVSEQEWRAKIREWFPSRYDGRLVRPTVGEIEKHHAEIERLVGLAVPVSVIHQRLRDEEALDASVASVRRYVRGRFPDRPKSASEVEFAGPPVDPGESAQVDYGYLGVWLDPFTGRRRRVWAFSMVLSYSRHLFIYPVLKMDQRAFVEAHVAAFSYYGGCVSRVVLDNLRTGVVKADIYDPKLNRAYAELASHYQVLLDPARPYKPKDKPRIEALQGYIRRSFFFGREFSSFAEMSVEARRWNVEVAGRRTPRALEGRTTHEVFVSEEQGALLPLPAAGFELATWSRPKVGPDAHAKVGRTLYSLPYKLIGCRLDARSGASVVTFYSDGEVVKTHPLQERGRRTDWADLPEHRVGFYMRTPVWCRAQAVLVGPATDTLVGELLSVNVLYRLRQAQGILHLGETKGDARLEAACRRALEVGDPSYRTVHGILKAGTENETDVQLTLPGIAVPAWLRGPEAFSDGETAR